MAWIGAGLSIGILLSACSTSGTSAARTFPGGDPSAVGQYSTDPYAGGNAPPVWGGPSE
jgi:hypothetical protein